VHDFAYHAPESLPAALALLDEYGEEARVMAGGTALVVLLKQSLVGAEHIVSLDRIPGLAGIRVEDGVLHIGALTHHREIEQSPEIRAVAPLLAEVYGHVGTVRIRNAATVGGGLAHADPAQDPPPGLIALGASVRLVSSRGERVVDLDDFFRDYYETAIRPDEILIEVMVPVPAQPARGAYLKFLPRTIDDYATVAVAAQADVEDGTVRTLRVGLASAGPTPVHAATVEAALLGKAATPEAIRAAAEAVRDDIDPMDDFRGSADYKRDMAVVFTRRALERVLAP